MYNNKQIKLLLFSLYPFFFIEDLPVGSNFETVLLDIRQKLKHRCFLVTVHFIFKFLKCALVLFKHINCKVCSYVIY